MREIFDRVLARDQRVCQMCGADESCLCPIDLIPVSLHLRLIRMETPGMPPCEDNLRIICSTCADGLKILIARRHGEDISSNLRAVCSNCNEGLQNAAPIKPDRLQLLAQIRRATLDDQREVLNWLLRKFKLQAGSES